MVPPTYDFSQKRGVPLTLPLTYRSPNNSDGTLGAPIDITGWTAHMQIRTTASSSEVIADLTSSSGITLGGAAGTIVPAAATTDWSFTTAAYDIFLHDLSNAPICILQGTITLEGQVTQ